MIQLDRKYWISLRKQVENRKEKEKAIVEKLLPFLENKQKIGTYIPIQAEVDVYSCFSGREVYVPKVIDDTHMVFCKNTHLSLGKFSIPEPDLKDCIEKNELEVILIPMVAFDYPYRMGYGKGYYDRYLKDCPALKIGIAFDCQQAEFKNQAWDIPMDWIITETQILGGTK